MSEMPKSWYIHKWYLGEYRGCQASPNRSFDEIDWVIANLFKGHQQNGWTYEITGSAKQPRLEFVEQGAGI